MSDSEKKSETAIRAWKRAGMPTLDAIRYIGDTPQYDRVGIIAAASAETVDEVVTAFADTVSRLPEKARAAVLAKLSEARMTAYVCPVFSCSSAYATQDAAIECCGVHIGPRNVRVPLCGPCKEAGAMTCETCKANVAKAMAEHER